LSISTLSLHRRIRVRHLILFSQNINDHIPSTHKVMPSKEYRSLTIPEGVYQRLENFVNNSNGHYVSVSEVVREALRTYLRAQV
jgi:hypothetical protein